MEKALIGGLFPLEYREDQIERILDELASLACGAGAQSVGRFWQKRQVADRAHLIGRGKAESIKAAIEEQQAEIVILHNELSGVQQRNLEELFQVKVVDRTRLILDIFALRARSLEGKLQVELAQLLYLMPRLTGWGTSLSRLGGGIGTRGPGETKLEADRRTIKKRISLIRERLEKVKQDRSIRRRGRRGSPAPLVSLAGYTSSGKSTLFNRLTGAQSTTSAQLFSTLDPLLRRVELKGADPGYYFMLSDTVGFIRDLPRELFTSFQATLEEVVQADIILHVIDLSNPDHRQQQAEVEKVLLRMGVEEKCIIKVFNKIDLLEDVSSGPLSADSDGIYLSALRGKGLDKLHQAIYQAHFSSFQRFSLTLDQDGMITGLDKWTIVLSREFRAGKWKLEVLSERGKMLEFIKKHGGVLE